MDWEYIRRISGRFLLILLEVVFKLCATIAAAIALATPGSLSDKIGAGFGSLTTWLRKLTEAPGELMEMGNMINDFTTQTAADFSETYGPGAVELLIFNLNMAIEFIVNVYENLTQTPLSTIFGALIVFLTFYLLARTLRFIRQKGQGSVLTRFERKLGVRLFKLERPAPAKMQQDTVPSSTSVAKPAQRSKFPTSRPRSSASAPNRFGTKSVPIRTKPPTSASYSKSAATSRSSSASASAPASSPASSSSPTETSKSGSTSTPASSSSKAAESTSSSTPTPESSSTETSKPTSTSTSESSSSEATESTSSTPTPESSSTETSKSTSAPESSSSQASKSTASSTPESSSAETSESTSASKQDSEASTSEKDSKEEEKNKPNDPPKKKPDPKPQSLNVILRSARSSN